MRKSLESQALGMDAKHRQHFREWPGIDLLCEATSVFKIVLKYSTYAGYVLL